MEERPVVCLVLPRFKYPSGDIYLGLAYVAAYLREKNPAVDVRIVDATFNPSLDFFRREFARLKPIVVGIYMGTIMYGDALAVASLAHSTGAKTIIGGPHPSVMPETVITHPGVDALCIGEGEVTFSEYVEASLGSMQYDDVTGIWFKNEKGEVVKTPARAPVESLDDLPFPALDLFDVETYMRNWIPLESVDPDLKGLPIVASRGCPFQCTYCQPTLRTIFGQKTRLGSPEHVIAELTELKRRYGIGAFYFMDDSLTAFKKWMEQFCQCLIDSNLGLLWAVNSRADTFSKPLFELMRQAGLVKTKVGIEAISDRVRNEIYRKKVSREQIVEYISQCRDLGIQVGGFFMLGAPTETAQEIRETINFAVTSDLTEANFSITTPLPQTDLYTTAVDKGWALPTSFEAYDYYRATRTTMAEGDISNFRLELYKKSAYLLFYLHPKRLGKVVSMGMSIDGFKRTLLKLRRL